MAQIPKTTVDADLRVRVFEELGIENGNFAKINDRQYGGIRTDLNGVERYVRIGAIVAEEREDMTARELMKAEIDKYNEAQEKKEKRKRENAEKAAAKAKAEEDGE